MTVRPVQHSGQEAASTMTNKNESDGRGRTVGRRALREASQSRNT